MGNKLGSKRGKYNIVKVNKGCFKDEGKYIEGKCLICNNKFSF